MQGQAWNKILGKSVSLKIFYLQEQEQKAGRKMKCGCQDELPCAVPGPALAGLWSTDESYATPDLILEISVPVETSL